MSSYLGQNFLKDHVIIKRIAQTADTLKTSLDLHTIREIGPGKGAITRHFNPDHTFVFEKDETFKDLLQGLMIPNHIIRGDVLKTFPSHAASLSSEQASRLLIVGNLPYYITSPILSMICSPTVQEHIFGGILVMIQHEVGDKIRYDATKKSYLRWICNYRYHVRYRKKVRASCFSPAPRVDSCMIQLQPKSLDQCPTIPPDKLYQVLDLISGYKRKTLGKIIKMLTKKNISIHIAPEQGSYRAGLQTKRLEECTRDDMSQLCEYIEL